MNGVGHYHRICHTFLLLRRKKKCIRASEGDEEEECESKCEGITNNAQTSSEGVKANSTHQSDGLAVGASLSASLSSKSTPVEESIPSSLTIKQEASTWLDSFTTFPSDWSSTSYPASLTSPHFPCSSIAKMVTFLLDVIVHHSPPSWSPCPSSLPFVASRRILLNAIM